MTKTEALMYLGADEDNWEEILELNLFNLKKNIFNKIIIPKVILKKSEKAYLWYNAECLLLNHHPQKLEKNNIKFDKIEDGNINLLINLYRSYENKLTYLQLKLSQSYDTKEVAELLMNIAKLEMSRQKAILPIAVFFKEYLKPLDIKLTDEINTGVIISELKQFKKELITEKKDLLLLPNFEKDLKKILKSNL